MLERQPEKLFCQLRPEVPDILQMVVNDTLQLHDCNNGGQGQKQHFCFWRWTGANSLLVLTSVDKSGICLCHLHPGFDGKKRRVFCHLA